MISARLKAFVDESARLIGRVVETSRQNLLRVGEVIQKEARSRIRIGRGPSLPGQPPVSRTGEYPASIQVELEGNGVLVGPVAKTVGPDGSVPVGGSIPANLEGGGQRIVTEVYRAGRWQIAKGPTGRLPTRKRVVTVEPRPVMGPALVAVGPQIPSFWEDTL